jgi:hypothetical protein
MSVEWPEITIAGAAVITLAGAGFAWVYNRIESLRRVVDDNDKAADKVHDELHDRISDTRENWTPRAEFEKTESRLESRLNAGLTDLGAQIQKVGESLNSRLDLILVKFNGGNGHRGPAE